MELESALAIANNIVQSITHACERVTVAGSIRRGKENVKDVEILAIVKDYDVLFTTLSAFGKFIKPGVPDIIEWSPKKGAKYIRMLLNENIKLDLFVASKENWGGLLAMRTGPAVAPKGNVYNAFVPALFKKWKKASGGGKMTAGQPTMPDGTMLPVYEEEDFFKMCGVQWLEPRDRIDAKSLKKIEQ